MTINFKIRDEAMVKPVVGRKAIFLDSAIWIDLADERGEQARRIKALLRKLVKDEVVFCPLAPALFWELYKQRSDSALRVGTLMEELSLNISFASNDEIYMKEVENFVYSFVEGKKLSLAARDLYVPVAAYLSSQASLLFPEEFPNNEREKLAEQVARAPSTMKLSDFLMMRKSEFPRKERGSPQYSEARRKRWEFTRGSKDKAWRVEAEYLVQNLILPWMNKVRAKLPIDMQLRFWAYIDSLPKDKHGGSINAILEHMLALKNWIDILTIVGLDRSQQDRMNDFYDIEMMIVPLAYANVFVARDRWIKHLLTQESEITTRNGSIYVPDLPAFEEYLMNVERGANSLW